MAASIAVTSLGTVASLPSRVNLTGLDPRLSSAFTFAAIAVRARSHRGVVCSGLPGFSHHMFRESEPGRMSPTVGEFARSHG